MILYPHCRLKYTKIPQSWTAGHWAAQLFTKGKWFLIHCHSLSQPMKRLKPVTFHLQNLWHQKKDFNWILQLSKVFICLSATHLSCILNTSKIKTMFLEIHFLQRLAGLTTYLYSPAQRFEECKKNELPTLTFCTLLYITCMTTVWHKRPFTIF